eukprot:scaffold3766_cov124-Isochrysis_galbana.AAC.8
MVPGSSGVSQRFLCCGHGKLELACNQGTVRRNRFTEPLAVRLEGLFQSCVQGASNCVWVVDWVARGREFGGFEEEGWFGRPSGRNGCRRFARLGLRLFCVLLVPGAKECPQAPQDDAGRGTPERKGLRKSQVEGLCLKRFAQVQGRGRVAHGARWAAGVVGRT